MSPTNELVTKEEILQIIEHEKVKFIEMQFCDILGVIKTVSIPATLAEKAINDGVYIDGSSIMGYTTIDESDMRTVPILNSFQIYPWTSDTPYKTARFMCQIYDHQGGRFAGDPRYVLERMIDKASRMGYSYNVGPEFEFFLFKLDGNNGPLLMPNDHFGYFDLIPQDDGDIVRKEIMMYFDEMGYNVEAAHHEVADGQHEVDMRYTDALTVADRMLTLKYGIKTIAKRHGLHATFMAKPLYGQNGSGMHIHQSLIDKEGNNVFYDPDGKYQLSKECCYYIGGTLKYIREMTSVLNPTVNSYKRLVPGYEAPCYVAWANRNRSALIRVPAARKMGTRIELRNPDPTGNPYLMFAVMLAAGLKGIEDREVPPAPIEKNIFTMNGEQRLSEGIESLPDNLSYAISLTAESELMRDVLGDHIFENYIHIKNEEWDQYRTFITDWEIRRYMHIY
ncbi:MAG: glutamine synthetase [Candidatus Methanomethylophilaceae archaeon]|nr:glutamine synthetase [Candidatus Methanomethylophilaceae archaeon]MDI3541630.1 glutamine synthetase [Candidatus Methanomethylophilaceae archaeon]HIJ00198.1 glutamine synthetase [Candidatus Methanomethylophilaceae archaeon]